MDYLGIDTGIRNQAVDSDGNIYTFEKMWKNDKEKNLILYSISNAILNKAKTSNRGLAVEKVFRLDRKQAAPWKGNNRYRTILYYVVKQARLQKIPVVYVDHNNTSKECSSCGNLKDNFRYADEFKCAKCKIKLHADINAAKNMRKRALKMAPAYGFPPPK